MHLLAEILWSVFVECPFWLFDAIFTSCFRSDQKEERSFEQKLICFSIMLLTLFVVIFLVCYFCGVFS